MLTRISKALRRAIAEEAGQSLIIIALAMTAFAGAGALAIDVSSWYSQRHQDQLVADAAALAAANCLANPSSPTGLGPACNGSTATTQATQAQTVAIDYAAKNGLTLSAGQVHVCTTSQPSACAPNQPNQSVAIDANANVPGLFASLFSIHTVSTSAGATASWKTGGPSSCTASAQSQGLCYAIYTQNATCGSTDGFTTSNTYEVITGAIHSQGALNISSGTFKFQGPLTYSSGNCTVTVPSSAYLGGGNYTPAAGGNQPANYWPIDYSTVFPACSSTGTYRCTTVNGINGVPSYCTDASTSSSGITFSSANADELVADHVYCSIGSGNPSNPATWNGPIDFTDGASAGSSKSPLPVTFIGGYIDSGSTSPLYLEPAPNTDNCLFYALDADSNAGSAGSAIDIGNSDYQLAGSMFAPNGTISMGSTYLNEAAMFLEAQNVNATSLTFSGSGPVVSTSGTPSSSSGTDSLTQ